VDSEISSPVPLPVQSSGFRLLVYATEFVSNAATCSSSIERGRPGLSSQSRQAPLDETAAPLPNRGFGQLDTICDLGDGGAFRRPLRTTDRHTQRKAGWLSTIYGTRHWKHLHTAPFHFGPSKPVPGPYEDGIGFCSSSSHSRRTHINTRATHRVSQSSIGARHS
jgi:hypothetical protein